MTSCLFLGDNDHQNNKFVIFTKFNFCPKNIFFFQKKYIIIFLKKYINYINQLFNYNYYCVKFQKIKKFLQTFFSFFQKYYDLCQKIE